MNVHIKDSQQPAQACVIWMHGLGADAQDMMGVAEQLPLSVPVRHVFLDAPIRPVTLNNRMPMRAWYDIVGFKLSDREDKEGILESEGIIRQAIEQQLAQGMQSQQIFLAGFSQGGAMALYAGLRTDAPLAGIIALSSYLPLAAECSKPRHLMTPIFMAMGQFDPIVIPAWSKQTHAWLMACGLQKMAWHEYPMEHSICNQEIRDLSQWLSQTVVSFNNSTTGAV